MNIQQEVPKHRPEHYADLDPERLAVVGDDGATLTYAAWNRAADQLAAVLPDMAGGGTSVCVVSHHHPEWFVVNLAIAKLGWEHVAVSWVLTPADQRRIVNAYGSPIVFTDTPDLASFAETMAADGVRCVGLTQGCDGVPGLWDLLVDPDPPRLISRGEASFVKYTSGTTGTPKGVRRPPVKDAEDGRRRAESIRGPEAMVRERFPHAPYFFHKALVTMPLHHGVGPRGARVCHAEGGTVYLLDRFDPRRVLETVDRHGITHWNTVPTMLHRIRMLGDDTVRSFDLSSLRMVAVGAAPITMELKEWVLDNVGECLFEGYGASEVGMVTLMVPWMHREKPHSCGILRPHVEVRVLDENGRDVPRGEEGELFIRTPLTIDSYLGDEDGTHRLDADGFFRIGDYGRLDEDDYLYITGRAKDMIIRGGVNIHPVDIEHVISGFPGVADAAVVGIPDEEFGEQVAAFVEIAGDEQPDEAALRAYLDEHLARIHRPTELVFVDALPRNLMGKVLKPELRARAGGARPAVAGPGR